MHCWAFFVIVVMLLSCLYDGSIEFHDVALLEKLHKTENLWMCCPSLQEWVSREGGNETNFLCKVGACFIFRSNLQCSRGVVSIDYNVLKLGRESAPFFRDENM